MGVRAALRIYASLISRLAALDEERWRRTWASLCTERGVRLDGGILYKQGLIRPDSGGENDATRDDAEAIRRISTAGPKGGREVVGVPGAKGISEGGDWLAGGGTVRCAGTNRQA